MLPISKMAAAVQPSATLAAGAKARQLKAEGKTVFDFSLGEPDFTTPEHICAAADKAMHDGHTHYTPAGGIAEVQAAIARWYKQDLRPRRARRSRSSSPTAPSTRIHNALAAMVGPGDEVIIPTPYWVSYSDLVQMTGAKYVLVPTTRGERLQDDARRSCAAAITPRSRLLMLNSPSNPTGSVYTRAELEALADVVLETKRRRPQRRDLRAARLRRRQGDLLRHAAAGPAGADDHHQRRRARPTP